MCPDTSYKINNSVTATEIEIESYVQEAKSITEKLCINELQEIRFFFDNIDNVLGMGLSSLNNTQLCKMLMFQITDYPFSWIDFYPLNHFVIFGADSQVWEHLEKLKMEFPFKYQWFNPWLGEFHKLGNLHQRIAKRFLKFHLEKHASAYLNDPTPAKLQKFIKFDDFDSSNDFYLTDSSNDFYLTDSCRH